MGSLKNSDGIVLAVAHRAYADLGSQKLLTLLRSQERGVVIDVKGMLDQSKLPKSLAYWRL